MTLPEFLERYGDELTGLVVRSFGETLAVQMIEGDPQRKDALLGRAYRKREERALDLLKRIYTELTEKVNNGKTEGRIPTANSGPGARVSDSGAGTSVKPANSPSRPASRAEG